MLILAEAIQCVLAYHYVRQAATISITKLLEHCWRSVAVTLIVAAAVLSIAIFSTYGPSSGSCYRAVASAAWVAEFLSCATLLRQRSARSAPQLRAVCAHRRRAHDGNRRPARWLPRNRSFRYAP